MEETGQTPETDNTQPNKTSTEQTGEPTTASEPVDWQAKYEAMRAHSRKWEERAKANSQAAEQLEKLQAQADEQTKTITGLKEKLTGYEHQEEKRKWAADVSQKTGVPAELLDADTLEGMQAQAERLSKYLRPRGLPGQGSTPSTEPAGSSTVAFARRLFGTNK